MKAERITKPGRVSRVTGFTTTGKPRKTGSAWGSCRTTEWQAKAYQRAMETGKWSS